MNNRILPIAKINLKKYGKPPTWGQINNLISEVGISKYQFEEFYGIPYNHLARVKAGEIELGKNYWHIFYERIKLERGVGFEGIYEVLYNSIEGYKHIPNNIPRSVPKKVPSEIDLHGRLTQVV